MKNFFSYRNGKNIQYAAATAFFIYALYSGVQFISSDTASPTWDLETIADAMKYAVSSAFSPIPLFVIFGPLFVFFAVKFVMDHS